MEEERKVKSKKKKQDKKKSEKANKRKNGKAKTELCPLFTLTVTVTVHPCPSHSITDAFDRTAADEFSDWRTTVVRVPATISLSSPFTTIPSEGISLPSVEKEK